MTVVAPPERLDMLRKYDFSGKSVLPLKQKVIARMQSGLETIIHYYGGMRTLDWIVENMLEKVKELIQPAAVYQFELIVPENSAVVLPHRIMSFNSKDLARFCRGHKYGILFVATIGSKLPAYALACKSEQHGSLDSFACDAIGSEAAETAVHILHNWLGERYSAKRSRFSPGYGDWNVAEQQKFFRVLDKEKVTMLTGVKLNESSYMIPEKSISGITVIKEK